MQERIDLALTIAEYFIICMYKSQSAFNSAIIICISKERCKMENPGTVEKEADGDMLHYSCVKRWQSARHY